MAAVHCELNASPSLDDYVVKVFSTLYPRLHVILNMFVYFAVLAISSSQRSTTCLQSINTI
eukprot:6456679-Amphidinium_carterae.2